MSILKIFKWPDEILSTKGVEVQAFDDELKKLVRDMAETMYASNGIGLAAQQVGKAIRVAVVDVPGDEEFPPTGLLYLVNPRIVFQEGSASVDEGCLSFPGIEVSVKRSEHVIVEYQDDTGEKKSVEARDLAAICLQHEIDHLDGITMVDRVGPIRRKLALHDYQKAQKVL